MKSYEEIARETGVGVETVRKHIHNALKKLRAALENDKAMQAALAEDRSYSRGTR